MVENMVSNVSSRLFLLSERHTFIKQDLTSKSVFAHIVVSNNFINAVSVTLKPI